MMQQKDKAAIPLAARAALASVAMAALLLALKAYAAWRTGSVSMLGSLADTGLDLLASLVTLYGVRLAAAPADEDHRFGHGKAEALAALFQVALISASALAIVWRAAQALGGAQPVHDVGTGMVVSGVTIAATLVLLAYQRRIIRRTNSVAIIADNVHYQSDVLLSIAVIAALALDRYAGIRWADPVFGIAIGLWLGYGALRASKLAVDMLMDREWSGDERAAFLEVAGRQPGVRGLHDLRTRRSGSRDFVQFHMAIDPGLTVAQAHVLVEDVERALARAFPKAEVLIHLDPVGQVDTRDELREAELLPER